MLVVLWLVVLTGECYKVWFLFFVKGIDLLFVLRINFFLEVSFGMGYEREKKKKRRRLRGWF